MAPPFKIFATFLVFLGMSLIIASATKGIPDDGTQLLEPPHCGVSLTNRISGGDVTEMDEFPWMALLITVVNDSYIYPCGGSLINSRYVLTAAHCYKERRPLISVRLGEWDTQQNIDCVVQMNGKEVCNLPHVDVPIERIIPHPDYNKTSLANDIMLLKLATPVSYTENVRPICVPNPMVFNANNYEGMSMIFSGWGKTEFNLQTQIKLKASLRVWNLDDCFTAYSPGPEDFALGRHQLCAGGEHSIGACKGDSGGPLMKEFTVNGRTNFYVMGVASYATLPCGLEGAPAVYTNVMDYWQWIKDTVGTN